MINALPVKYQTRIGLLFDLSSKYFFRRRKRCLHSMRSNGRFLQDQVVVFPVSLELNSPAMGSRVIHVLREKSGLTRRVRSLCSAGLVASNASSAYCSPCPEGTLSMDALQCIVCPEGSYCGQGASTPTPCTEVSSYCPKGSSAPIITKAGWYTNDQRTNVLKCEKGHYCVNGAKTPCPPNTYGESEGLTAQTCDGRCLAEANRYSNESATSCSVFYIRRRIIALIRWIVYALRARFGRSQRASLVRRPFPR